MRTCTRAHCVVGRRSAGPASTSGVGEGGGARAAIVAMAGAGAGVAACQFIGLDAGRSVMLWLATGAVAAWPFLDVLHDEPWSWWAVKWVAVGGFVTWILHST